jgi:hypothetical protein
MKVVKTHKNWVLGRRGYPVAFRFKPRGLLPKQYSMITNWLKDNRGPEAHFSFHDEHEDYRWTTHMARGKTWRDSNTYFIGLKEETDVTVILLTLAESL